MKGARRSGVLVVLAMSLATAGCEAGNTPIRPTNVTSQTLTGTLALGGVFTFPFTVTVTGTVTAVVENVIGVSTPDQATVGLGIGTWDGSTCTLILKNESATFNTAIVGTILAGNYCLQLYDVGQMTEEIDYGVRLDHT